MDIKSYLKEKNMKVTKGRICILTILENANNALSADFIFEKCKESGEELDLSTVYRTLELMKDKEILEKFDFGDGKYSYSIKECSHKHVLQCELCHKKVEIECPMVQVKEIIRNKTGFTLLQHELELKGICNECKSKED